MAFRPSAAPKVAVEERGGSDVDGLEEGAGGAFFDHESDGESGGEDDQQEGGRGSEDEAQGDRSDGDMEVDGDGAGDMGGDFTTLASWTEGAELDDPGSAPPLMLPVDDTPMILPTDDTPQPPAGDPRKAPAAPSLTPSDPRVGDAGEQEPRTIAEGKVPGTWAEKAEMALRVPEPLAALQALVAAPEGGKHAALRARLAGMVQAAEAFTKKAQVPQVQIGA
ncbi:hypothetical protein T484DRAFT_1772528 [Baffinella frigidus]|nr:hypothetical protein T484DRAFT_1772528 [Cryptophyta sp. CCMP2293]